MSLVLRRTYPNNELSNVRRLLDEAFTTWPFGAEGGVTSAWLPPTDVFEDRETLRVVVELPGLKPEDVKITLENYTLTIRGEKKQQSEQKSERVHRHERNYGAFVRSFALPNTIDSDRVQAAFEHGVLTVSLPKAERAKPREIEVAVR